MCKVFVLISAAVALISVFCGGLSLWLLPLVFLGCLAALILLVVLMIIVAALLVDTSKPIEKVYPLSHISCNAIADFLIFFGMMKPEISGLEKIPEDRRFLMVSNHRSAADPMIIKYCLMKQRIGFISKPSNMALPVLGKMAYGAGFLAIDRENDRNALKTIITAANYLKKGICSICIFPEGTRSRDGKLLPFHAGSFKTAQKAGAPLVIACCVGTDTVKKNFLKLRPSKLRFDVLEVLDEEQVKAMSSSQLAEYSRELIGRHIDEVSEA